MNPTFKHSPFIHLLGIGGSLFLAWLTYQAAVEPFERGGPMARVVLVGFCAALALGVLVLYLTSGVNRYEVAAEGLRIRRFLRTTFHPWPEIIRIDFNRPLHYIVIRGYDHRIAYSSTDFFPQMLGLIRAIHERSGCALAPFVTTMLNADKAALIRPMTVEDQYGLRPILERIAGALVEATPEWWKEALLRVEAVREEGEVSLSHSIGSREYPQDRVTATERVVLATRELQLFTEQLGQPWAVMLFTIKENREEWRFAVEFEYAV